MMQDQYPPRMKSAERRSLIWACVVITVIPVCLLALMLLAGCASDPVDKVTQARGVYTAALNALSDARKAGLIDDDTARQIEKSRKAAAAALDSAERSALAGEAGWKVWLDAALAAVDDFAAWRARVGGSR